MEPARPWKLDDRPAIREAFRALCARTPRDGHPVYWPAPGDLLAAIPEAPKPYHDRSPDVKRIGNVKAYTTTGKAHAQWAHENFPGIPLPAAAVASSPAEQDAIDRIKATIGVRP